MTLKNKIAAITAASMVAFVGIGFAAWTFNNSVAQEAEESAYATSAIEAKNVTLSGNTEVYLVLDQEKPYWSVAVNTGAKPVELANGKITVTPDYDLQNQNDGASWTYTISSSIDVASDIATYVNVGSFVVTGDVTGTVTAAGGASQIAAVDYALPSLSYTLSKPSTYAEYQTMLSAVSGDVITFSFNCSFVED